MFLWSRTLELLDRADASAPFIAAGHKVSAARICAGEKAIGRVDFSAIDSPHPYALMLPQAETERLLEAHLNRFGLQVERGVKLDFLLDMGHEVKALLHHADGAREEFYASWVLGCDGARSTVRDEVTISYRTQPSQTDWILADVAIEGLNIPDNELAAYWHEDGFLAIFPTAPGRYRVIADAGRGEGIHPLEPTLGHVQAIVRDRAPGHLIVSAPVWLSGFRVQERNADQYRSGRVFLVGDAAHLHNPAGAQGMNMGMHDAVDLAWKLALVERGAAGADTLLASYDQERRGVADKVIANVSRLTAVSVMKHPAAQMARNLLGGFLLGLGPARKAVADTMTELSLTYKNSPMIGAGDGAFPIAVPGERMPPVAGQVPVGAGDTPRFALFAQPSADTAQLLRQYPELLEQTERAPPAPGCMWLVRPDGYVAAVGLSADIRIVRRYLERLHQEPTAA
jgi:2-polyprenyl-6-methoxyphenol hydroxylase-like FAD-dependent oxidoreductase